MARPRRRTPLFDLGDALLSATEDVLGGTGIGSSRARMLEDMDAGALLELLGDTREERLATIKKLMKKSSAEDIAELVLILTQAVSSIPPQ